MLPYENKAVIMAFMMQREECWVDDKSIDPSQPLCMCVCVCVCVVGGGIN